MEREKNRTKRLIDVFPHFEINHPALLERLEKKMSDR